MADHSWVITCPRCAPSIMRAVRREGPHLHLWHCDVCHEDRLNFTTDFDASDWAYAKGEMDLANAVH